MSECLCDYLVFFPCVVIKSVSHSFQIESIDEFQILKVVFILRFYLIEWEYVDLLGIWVIERYTIYELFNFF